MKDVRNMTVDDLLALPHAYNIYPDLTEVDFDSLVLVPGSETKLHDSGYRYIVAVGVIAGEGKCLLTQWSDVVHIEGIGGRGPFDLGTNKYKIPENTSWNIDCLPKSGCFQLFLPYHTIRVNEPMSSFEIFSVKRNPKEGA
jgi:hypothetical protein